MCCDAGARCCTVTVTPTQVTVTADGSGAPGVDGHGMRGLRERAEAAGGSVVRSARTGHGSTLMTFGRPGFLRRALRAARAGGTAADVAREVQLSEGTVRTTSRPAIGKMGARTRADAVRIADENGWL